MRSSGWSLTQTADDFVRGFQVFDRDQTGRIAVGELKYVLTSLGEKLSDQEVDELLRGVHVGSCVSTQPESGRADFRAATARSTTARSFRTSCRVDLDLPSCTRPFSLHLDLISFCSPFSATLPSRAPTLRAPLGDAFCAVLRCLVCDAGRSRHARHPFDVVEDALDPAASSRSPQSSRRSALTARRLGVDPPVDRSERSTAFVGSPRGRALLCSSDGALSRSCRSRRRGRARSS